MLSSSAVFAQEESTGDDYSEFFENAGDIDEPVITGEPNPATNYAVSLGSLQFPIEVSGKMTSELGLAYVRKDTEEDVTGYFDFKNYIYFTTRPDKYLALKGTIKSSLPADSDDELDNQSNYFYVYEIYFDYLMFDRIYVTAGKKKTVWGNIRLFSDTKEYEGDEDALCTNILYDSLDHMSGIIKIPVSNHTFTGLAMYRGGTGNDSPGTKDMSFAGSAEFIFFNTSINFIGRRFPIKDSEIVLQKPELHKNSILGLELKRTIFGFDIYGQGLGKLSENEDASLRKVFKSKFDDLTAFEKIISTGGVYRMWTGKTPYFGFNFEFQNIYTPEPEEDKKFFVNRFASYMGIAKLGPNKDISIGVQWNNNITEKTGFVKPGINFSKVLPHCDWRFGAKYEYGYDELVKGYSTKLTLGTYITISMDY